MKKDKVQWKKNKLKLINFDDCKLFYSGYFNFTCGNIIIYENAIESYNRNTEEYKW